MDTKCASFLVEQWRAIGTSIKGQDTANRRIQARQKKSQTRWLLSWLHVQPRMHDYFHYLTTFRAQWNQILQRRGPSQQRLLGTR